MQSGSKPTVDSIPVSEMSLSLSAYKQIKQKIVTLQLSPETVIHEAHLQEELEVGRTPVREALLRLEREKLVVILPRRGIFVSAIRPGDLKELFEVRVPLEMLAVELATNRGTYADWQKLEKGLAAERNGQASGQAQLVNADASFHAAIYAAANNRFLQDSLTIYYALSLRLWHYAMPTATDLKSVSFDHASILAAMRAGHGSQAAHLMQEHMIRFQANVQDAVLTRLTKSRRKPESAA